MELSELQFAVEPERNQKFLLCPTPAAQINPLLQALRGSSFTKAGSSVKRDCCFFYYPMRNKVCVQFVHMGELWLKLWKSGSTKLMLIC